MLKDQNVLVVDDDPQILKLLRMKLNSHGIKTTCAPNGENALLSLQNDVYNCIISDLYMPGKNGFDLLMDIQKTYHYIPVIIISGKNVGASNAKKVNKEGAFYYLPKPFKQEDLDESLDFSFKWNMSQCIDTIARKYLNIRDFDPEKNPEKLATIKRSIKRFANENRSVKGVNDFLNPHKDIRDLALYRYLENRFHQDAHYKF